VPCWRQLSLSVLLYEVSEPGRCFVVEQQSVASLTLSGIQPKVHLPEQPAYRLALWDVRVERIAHFHHEHQLKW
jgi:hypothetical protein